MTLAYAKQLNFQTQKIDGSSLNIFRMVIAGYQVIDELGKAWFFQKIFLLANNIMKVVLEMPFLTFSNTNIQFAEKELTWSSYTTEEALPTTH